MKIKKLVKEKGLTLIEILLYFFVLSIVLTSLLSFSIHILNISSKSDNMHELQVNIEFISEQIIETIQIADAINDSGSVFDNDIGTLSLNVSDAYNNPINFYLKNGEIYQKKGANTAVKITSDLITCSQLRFSKVVVNKVPDQVVIDFQCAPLNNERSDIASDISFHNSISLRK